jgi:hypothetical protein
LSVPNINNLWLGTGGNSKQEILFAGALQPAWCAFLHSKPLLSRAYILMSYPVSFLHGHQSPCRPHTTESKRRGGVYGGAHFCIVKIEKEDPVPRVKVPWENADTQRAIRQWEQENAVGVTQGLWFDLRRSVDNSARCD